MRLGTSVAARSRAALLGVSFVALSAPAFAAEYKMTVNQDRLIHADREPQNWLMMNGDYGSTRYSKLCPVNRDNVKNLHMVWAMALRGMQDIGQNGPENEVNPLIDNGFMYTSDGWGTVYKIDVRSGDHGEFVWIADPGASSTRATSRRPAASRCGKTSSSTIFPDGRVIAINRDSGEIMVGQAGGEAQRVQQQGALPLRADRRRRQNDHRERLRRRRTRGWIAALDAKTGNELWRWYVVPKPGDPGSETWKDKNNAWKTGGGGMWQTGSYDPVNKLTIWGTGNPVPMYDPQSRPGDNLYTNSVVAVDVNTGKLQWYYQYLPNDSWDYDEIGIQMLYDVNIGGEPRKVIGHFGRNGFFYTLDRANGSFIKGAQYVNDLNWTKGLDPKTGKPIEYDPKLDVQTYQPEARALRGDPMKRACPTWHGGVAHQPTAYNPVKQIAYGVGTEGCFSQNGAEFKFKGPDGGLDAKGSQKRNFTSDLYYGAITAYDVANQKVLAKTVTDIEIRSGATATAGGVVFSALQDGWVVAYDDENLHELWRFNVGTPLKGAPVVFAIGPKEYLAVQTSGRHLHPVKYDNLEHSSYLFVFALN